MKNGGTPSDDSWSELIHSIIDKSMQDDPFAFAYIASQTQSAVTLPIPVLPPMQENTAPLSSTTKVKNTKLHDRNFIPIFTLSGTNLTVIQINQPQPTADEGTDSADEEETPKSEHNKRRRR